MARRRNEGPKVEAEVEMMTLMTEIYCRGNKHPQGNGLCNECAELLGYAKKRIEACPCMEEKTFCSTCPVHCYNARMRERVRAVMRYSGPRMLFVRPAPAIRHCIDTLRARSKAAKKH